MPMRMKVSAPHWMSSSMAMAVEGQPMPVEVHETLMPSTVPVKVRYSRLKATSWASSKKEAIFGTRPGSPGRSTYRPTSPFLRCTWYWRSGSTSAKAIAPSRYGWHYRLEEQARPIWAGLSDEAPVLTRRPGPARCCEHSYAEPIPSRATRTPTRSRARRG